MNKLLILLGLIAILQVTFSDDVGDNSDSERDEEIDTVSREEAIDFLKRSIFHPFSTRNEEQKRETYEVYEEKCKSIVPTQRYLNLISAMKIIILFTYFLKALSKA
jgi:hypothetical protein